MSTLSDLAAANPYYHPQVLMLLMNSLPDDWTERKKIAQAKLQYADIRCFLIDEAKK